jgi:hypothetical protein
MLAFLNIVVISYFVSFDMDDMNRIAVVRGYCAGASM